LGSPALTARRLEKKEFEEIAEIIHDVLQNPSDPDLKKVSKSKVKILVKIFQEIKK
jgi:glycine/serine hydroxymethyltransferase